MTTLPEVHLVGGSCAEALRLAPVAIAMREQHRVTPILIAAGPDPAAVDDTFAAFDLTPMVTLPTGPDPSEALRRLDAFWAARTPAAVVLRDCLPAAMAAHWRRVPISQIDAGRRSGGLGPAGTESDRRLLAQVATLHMAATPLAAMNLFDERVVPGDVLLTGSTSADAAQTLGRRRGPAPAHARRVALVGLTNGEHGSVVAALRLLATRHTDLDAEALGRQSCVERARRIAEAYVVVTDDEDLAADAVASGTPALVVGDAATHAESLDAGSARLVGPDPATIAAEVAALLESRVRRDGMAAGGNPYGDGLAAYRIAQATAALLGHGQFPDPMPAHPVAGVSR